MPLQRVPSNSSPRAEEKVEEEASTRHNPRRSVGQRLDMKSRGPSIALAGVVTKGANSIKRGPAVNWEVKWIYKRDTKVRGVEFTRCMTAKALHKCG